MQVVTEPGELRLQAGGTLNPRRHLYVERPDDEVLLKLLSEGQYVNVLTSRQMGKSSLMVRTAEIAHSGWRALCHRRSRGGAGDTRRRDNYFLGLSNKIARDLKIKVDLPTWWTERVEETMNQRLMRFFREVVLEQVPGPVVCFLDEIDSTLKLPWTDDLFTALRGMHNERPMVPAYERLTFCLIGVAWPNELIKDRRTTPYNVGSTLELRDFDLGRDDLTPLAAALSPDSGHGLKLIERVLYWTGGHPYLTTRLCASLIEIGAKTAEDVDRRVDILPIAGAGEWRRSLPAGASFPRDPSCRRPRDLQPVREDPQRRARARSADAYPHRAEALRAGQPRRGRYLVVRNRIYERLFDQGWVESTKTQAALAGYTRGEA